MTQRDYLEDLTEEIKADLRELDIAKEALENEINLKRIELEAIKRKRIATEARRQSINRINQIPVCDKVRVVVRIGDTVEITNSYSKFSGWKEVRGINNSINKGRSIRGYDRDKYGIVTKIEKGIHQGEVFDKVFFITDSGKDTWRRSSNIIVINEQRGYLCHTVQQRWWVNQPGLETHKC